MVEGMKVFAPQKPASIASNGLGSLRLITGSLSAESVVVGTGCGLPLCALLSETNSHLLPCLSVADDGKLSLEEFQLFFADGVLNEKELEGLFHTIDSDNTK